MVTTCIKPFIEAAAKVFQTMVQLPLEPGKPTPLEGRASSHDVSGIIGMSGDVVGVVILGLPTKTAEAIIEKFVGEPMDVGSDDFADAIGELVNMIAGNAKADFEGKAVSISCPSVIFGSSHRIAVPSNAVGLHIPFNSSCGPFALEFSLKLAKESPALVAAAPVADAH